MDNAKLAVRSQIKTIDYSDFGGDIEAKITLIDGREYYGYALNEATAAEVAIDHAARSLIRDINGEVKWYHRWNPCDIDAHPFLERVQRFFELFAVDCRCCNGVRIALLLTACVVIYAAT